MPEGAVEINGNGLTLEQVAAVSRRFASVEVDPQAIIRVRRCRALVERLLNDASKPVVYGLNTGFGSLRNILIEPDKVQELQRNLIRSHSCGVGPPASVEVVRAMMLLRANTIAKGYSGVRPVVVDTLLKMLNRRVHPVVPVKGSVGASGDLAPLSHLVLVMMGEGEALTAAGERIPGEQAMREADISPLELDAKEGLALNNGTQFMTAIGALAILDAEYLVRLCALTCGLSLEAIKGVSKAFDRRIHDARPHPGQQEIARLIAEQIEGSEILAIPVNTARLHNARKCLQEAEQHLAVLEGKTHRKQRDRDLWPAVADSTRQLITELDAKIHSFHGDIAKELARPGRKSRVAGDPDEKARQAADAVFRNLRERPKGIYSQMAQVDLEHRVADTRDLIDNARSLVRKAMDELDGVIPDFVPVQDDYSFRCTPQICGAAMDTLRHVRSVLTIELNSATDNPLIFPPHSASPSDDPDTYAQHLDISDCKAAVVSGGNFHGEPIAIALDHTCIALAEVGNVSERRTFHLTSGHLNNGLPSFLTRGVGLHSGLMIAQYTAAALVSENKTLSHPASVDSIPTCEDTEDHVSMGAFAARKLADVLDNVRYILAIELICATQGVEFRLPARTSQSNQAIMQAVRSICPRVEDDRPLSDDIESLTEAVRQQRIDCLASHP